MYVIKLNRRATKNVGIYHKTALIVVNDYATSVSVNNMFLYYGRRTRKKVIQIGIDITPLLPFHDGYWFYYIEYRAIDDGEWENDIINLLKTIA